VYAEAVKLVLLAATLLAVPFPLSAHHATAAQYDVSKTVTVKGKITRIAWSNPHIHVYLSVKAKQDHEDAWVLEFPAPGAAIVAGLSKQRLAPETVLTVEVYPSKTPAREGQEFGCAKAVTLSDGSRLTFVVGI
jgi:hypothetical protein